MKKQKLVINNLYFYQMKVIVTIIYFFWISSISPTFSQIPYYSDCIKGGTVGDGYTAWITGGVSAISLPIPPGSSVKKAFFFSNLYKWEGNNTTANNKTITMNGQSLVLSESGNLGTSYYFAPSQCFVSTYVADITDMIDPSLTTYTINPFTNVSPVESPLFSDFYILVIYENPLLPQSCIDIYINKNACGQTVSFDINASHAIDSFSDVGLAIHSNHICDFSDDWYEVFINSTSIGLIGGEEDNTDVYCAGVIGSFFYQNGTIYGTGNDTGDNLMYGTDAVANIQPIINGDENIDLGFEYLTNWGPNSNLISQIFLTYTSTCDTFSVTTTPDTNICIGETLQLFATGGTSTGSAPAYEWSPATNLSCTDCPNPVFTGDTSCFYTVRIWNNDSCSVVRPVKVNVRPLPKIGAINITPSHCGTNNGIVSVSAISGTQTPLTFTLNDSLSQSSGTFNNLPAGVYTFHFTDGFGCQSEDTLAIVGEINTTVANFTVSPTYGVVPLAVDITNTSVNATEYLWSINGMDQGSDLSSYTCDTSGLYLIQLIAWQYDPSCADTVVMTVLAVDQLIIPTAFTPDNDGVNDRWVIPNIKNIYPNHLVSIYNRWGTLLYEAPEGKYNVYPWKGIYEDKELPVGSYYFIVDPNDGVTEVIRGIVSIVL